MSALSAREMATPQPEEQKKKPLELKVVPPEKEDVVDVAQWVQEEAKRQNADVAIVEQQKKELRIAVDEQHRKAAQPAKEAQDATEVAAWVQQENLAGWVKGERAKNVPPGEIASLSQKGAIESARASKVPSVQATGDFLAKATQDALPAPREKVVIADQTQEANEVAKWVSREHAIEFDTGSKEISKERMETQTLSGLADELDASTAQRTKLEQDIRRLDSPIHKVVEAFGKIGILKDTVAAFATWKQERARLEDELDSVDRVVAATEHQIKNIVSQREAGMRKQSAEIAEGSPAVEQELISKWFYNRSTEGGAVSEEARKEWEEIERRTETIDDGGKYIERRAIDREVVAGLKGLNRDDQTKIDNWFVDPGKFVELVDDDLQTMGEGEDAITPQERNAWKENKLPPDTSAAIEKRLEVLKTDTAALERRRNQLEDGLRRAFSGGEKHPVNFQERMRFDEALRRKYLVGWVKRLFKNRGAGAEAFLSIEPELRQVEAQLSINQEAMRRAELALKDPHGAVREAAVREIGMMRRMIERKRENAADIGMPGAMRDAA